MSEALLEHLKEMRHSPAHNYVIPGLTSWLIGIPHPKMGCVRMFSMSRVHEEAIIPHSHRFDFRCIVLSGSVTNNRWVESDNNVIDTDEYVVSNVTYEGVLGKHVKRPLHRSRFFRMSQTYTEGQEYAMKAEEFHSIYFSKEAEVLFFEGPNRLEQSQILEPVVNDKLIPLFKTEKWMFSKG